MKQETLVKKWSFSMKFANKIWKKKFLKHFSRKNVLQVLPQQPVHEQAENEEEQDDDEEGDDMSSVSNEFSGLSVYDQPPGRGPK